MNEINPALLKGSERISCLNCDGIFFQQVNVFQKISKFKVAAPNDVIVPLMLHRCSDCGQPIQDELDMINDMTKANINEPEAIIKNLKPNSSIITH